MSACNKRPPEDHPMHSSGVACHMHDEHEGPCAWSVERSHARRGIDALLAMFPHREIEKIDNQLPHPIEVYDVDEHGHRAVHPYRRWDLPAGPWTIVKFVGGAEFGVWKVTGAVFPIGIDGVVAEDPIIEGLPQ